jgi:hypothetical protein
MINGFTGYLTDVSYALGSGRVPPAEFTRDVSGGVVGFSFDAATVEQVGLGLGASSDLLVIRTNAQTFTLRIANISNGAVTPVNALGPAGMLTDTVDSRIVPEPAVALVAMSLAGPHRRRRMC